MSVFENCKQNVLMNNEMKIQVLECLAVQFTKLYSNLTDRQTHPQKCTY